MKLKCIIVDDDINAINDLKNYINSLENIILVNAYTNPVYALKEITASESVNIVFMDIDMPMISGLDLAKAIRHKTEKLIFTTSHTEYALKAYEVFANDYLLKPFTFFKFAETINRHFPIEEKVEIKARDHSEYFFARDRSVTNSLIKIRIADILVIESSGNYVKIFTRNGSVLTYISLAEMRDILKSHTDFLQVHRSFIVAINRIAAIEGNTIRLEDGQLVTIGKSFRESVYDYIQKRTIKAGGNFGNLDG